MDAPDFGNDPPASDSSRGQGLTGSEYVALTKLAGNEPVLVDQLAPTLEVSAPAAAYIQHRLRMLGLLIRVADASPGRGDVLIVSTAGRSLVAGGDAPGGRQIA